MKLHLPTRLRAAVLACITAVAALSTTIGTGVVTVGSVTYVVAVSQAQAETTYNGVTYSGLIFDIATSASGTFHDRQFTNFYDAGTGTWVESTAFAGNQNSYYDGATQMNISQNFWREKFGDGAGRFQTLRLTGAGSDVYLETQFSPFTLGGLIAEAGDYTYTVGRTGGDCAITIQAEAGQNANMTIAADTRLSAGVNSNKNTITVASSGTWNIASGKTLTLARFDASGNESAVTGGVFLSEGVTVTLAGSGTAVINATTTTLNQGASFNIGATSTLNLTGTVNVLNDSVVESDIPTESNGYSQMTGSATVITIAEGGTLNADGVTWQLNGLAASYSNGVVSRSGESSKYYVNVDGDLATALDTKTTYVTIQNNATLNITNHTGGSAGMIKGNVLVKEGSTLKLSSGDALGWSGGNHVSVLTVENGATVNVNHTGNETFGGTLNLNGTLTGVDNSKWDFFTNSSMNIGEGAHASITGVQVRLRQTTTNVSLGNGSTLDIASEIVNNNTLNVTGSGTLNLTGGASAASLTLRKSGENNISTTAATFTKFYLGGGTTNISTTVNAGQVRLDENGSATLNINEGGVLNITGTNNDHSTDASLMLNHWGHTGTMVLNGGTLNAAAVDMHLSWDGTGVFQANAGTAKVQGISAWSHQDATSRGKVLLGSATEGSAKLIIGENGISDMSDQAVLKLGSGTLGASADWSLRYNDTHTESKAEFIATTEVGTIIDTTKVGGEEGEGATITFKNGTTGAGNMTVQGCGSLVLEGASDRTGSTNITGGTLVAKAATALGTGAVTVAGGTLALDTEDVITLGGLTMTSGAIKLAGAEKLAVTGAVTLSGGTLDLTNLADVITGAGTTVLGTVGGEVTGGSIAVSGLDASIISQYSFSVSKDGENLVLTAANASSALFWNGGNGNWSSDPTDNGWGTTGDDESTGDVYAAGSSVTISGSEGGTITVKGAQTAASLTIAHSGYTIAKDGTGSLAITGDLTVKESVTATFNFLPTVNGGIVLNSGSTLDMTGAGNQLSTVLFPTLEKTQGTGTLKLAGGANFNDDVANRISIANGEKTIGTKLDITENVAFNGWVKDWTDFTGSVTISSALSVGKEIRMETGAKLIVVEGGSLTAETLGLGHSSAGNQGAFEMTGGKATVGAIALNGGDATANELSVTGGTLTITGVENSESKKMEAFVGTGAATTVAISNATLTNGTTDLLFNHSSTLTDATITATPKDDAKSQAATTITVGGTGMTTTLVGTLTTQGNVVLTGTLDTTDLTGVTNSGDLTINAENVSLTTLSNTGSVTVTGDVELTTATTAGGDLSAADVTLTGANTFGTLTATGTVATDDTLTVGDGSDMAAVSEGTKLTTTGDVSIGSDASLAALSNAGNTLTVDGALTLTAATTAGGSVEADSLSLTGVNTFETLTLTGAVTLDTASYTSVGLTAGAVTGNSLALVVDKDTIVEAIGASTNALTLANVTGLTSATINGASSFKDGSREYTLSVTEGLVQITATVTNEVVWEGTAGEVWGDASAWESGTEPTADSNVMFNDKGIDDVKIGGTAVANSVIVESSKNFITDASGTVEAHSLEINKGTLTIDKNVAVVISGKDEAKGNTGVSGDGNIIIKGALETDVLAAASKDVQLSGSLTIKDSALIGSIGGITEGQDTAYGDLTVGDEIATTAEGDPVAGKVTLAEDSTVQNLTVTSTGDLTAEKKLTVLGDMLNVGSTTVKGDLTQGTEDTTTDTLTNNGTLNVTGTLTSENLVTESGSTLKAANLAADTLNTEGDITVTGTTTVSGDLTATGGEMRTNNLTMDGESATLDVSGVGTIVAVGGASSVDIDSVKVTNGGLFSSQSGNITADTITVSDAGSTLSANNKNATITADSVSVKNGGAIQSDAGAALTSSIKTDSLTIDGADSVVKIKAVNAKTAGSTTTVEVTNGGALAATNTVKATNVTVTGANSSLTAGGSDTVTGVDATTLKVQEGASFSATSAKATNATVDGTGTTATIGYGGLTTAETLTVTNGATLQGAVGDGNEGGDINAKTLVVGSGSSVKTTSTTGDPGNITVEKLEVASTGSVAAAGTLKVTDEIIGTAGEITADTLDLSGLTAAAAIADLKADTITLAGFDMLKVTNSLTDEVGTGKAQVTLNLDAATLSALAVGDEKTVIDTTDSFTLTNLGAINTALKAYGLKGEMVESGGKLVMQIQENSLLSQLGLTENGIAGLGMADDAAATGAVKPTGDLAGILAHLDDLRTAGTEEAAKVGDKIGAALSGASAAAMGLALSGDVDRQLKAIRNRTTIMGVNQAVVNEGLPYLNAWVNAEGDYSDIKADGTLPGYKLNSWGGTVGFDVDCTPTFTCGLAATAMYGDFDANSADKATGDLNTYYVSAFGRIASHRWTHTFVATAGMADTTLNRTVDGVKTKGESDGMMFGGMYEVGYVFALDKEATTCLQPIFNVSYTHATLNGYQEKGSDVALSVGDVEMNKLTLGLGARLQSVIGENIYNRSSLVEARALVKFHAGDRQGEVSNAFVKYAGSADAKSVETGAIGGEFGVGLTVPVGAEGGNIFMDASAEIRAEYINVNGTVGYRVNF